MARTHTTAEVLCALANAALPRPVSRQMQNARSSRRAPRHTWPPMRETSHAENPRMRRATSYPVDLSRMSAMEVAVATAPPEERDDFEAIAGVVGLLALKNKSPTPEEDYPAPMLPDDDEMESEEEEAPPPRPAPPPEGFFWQASPKQDGSMAGSSYVDGTFTLYLSALLEQNPSLATQPTALTALRMQQNGVHEPWNALRAPGSAAA